MEISRMVLVTIGMLLVQAMMMASGAAQGSWQVIQPNAGIASMHAAITQYNTAILLDRTNIGPSQILLPNGRCRDQPLERVLKHDCTAHSVMLDLASGAVRPLYIFTDTWCSSGQFFADGTMVQTGGDFEGNLKIRTLAPCPATGTCDWDELAGVQLAVGRWYASNQILQSGLRQIIVGGRAAANYEFYPKRKAGEGAFPLALLGGCCDNLYPYVFLLPNGNIYIFTTRDSVQLNYNTGATVRTYPTIPGNPRNYPSAGSAAMLPLSYTNGFSVAEVMICGGAATGASEANNVNAPASASCGRMVATAANAGWAMENMPFGRVMGEMIVLPNGQVIIINGAQIGFQGWGKAGNPAFAPLIYNPNAAAGARFATMAPTTIARMYHSTANLMPDGRILVAGSNTHQFYTFTGAFPTELRVEAYSPPYLGANFNAVRPVVTAAPFEIYYNTLFTVTFTVPTRAGLIEVYQKSSPYSTHSFSQGQRSLALKTTLPVRAGNGWTMQVATAPNNNIAPPSYYMLFVVQQGIPSKASWVKQNNQI